jgi:microcystin-dependent protein
MEKHLIFLTIIVIFIVFYCLFCNQMKETETFSTVTPTGIDDNNTIDTLGALASDYLTNRTQTNSTLILGNVNFKNRHVLVSDNDNWLRLKSKTDLSQHSNLAVKDFNVDGSFNLLPSGMIFAWSGETVPTGWIICDGSNGTPDLRGRFILGEGLGHSLTRSMRARAASTTAPDSSSDLSNYLLHNYGGRENITVGVTEMPSHSHSYNQPGETVVRNDHNDIVDWGGNHPQGSNSSFKSTIPNTPSFNTGNNQPLPFDNMPPYYVLVYIMKL